MINKIKKIVRQLLPLSVRRYLHIYSLPETLKEDYLINALHTHQKKALARLKKKESLKCCFFVLYEDVWKYDNIFQKMMKHPRFDPVILVCPVAFYGYVDMISRMKQCYDYFVRKGFNTIRSYDPNTKLYVDVNSDINPDVIFYTNPYRELIDSRYYIDKFRDVLTIYVPYSINNSIAWNNNYNLIFHNLLWRHYLPTEMHQSYAQKYARNSGKNTVVTGYPGIEEFLNSKHQVIYNVWKSSDPKLKKIIWAPHHTIEPVGPSGCVYYSCFLKYCDVMLDLAKKYKSAAQFVFKPHPLLKNKLIMLWGAEKTDEYYNKWASMENTSVHEGDYTDLFISSDAMIHDSGSFIAEYLYVNKPVMRTLNGVDESEKQNSFAMECIANHNLAYNERDIELFIQNVINGIDPLKNQRTKFVNEVLKPNGSPSQNILNDILDSIDNQILYRN